MIQKGSCLKVSDNSGAKWSKCIKVFGKASIAQVGDFILVTLKKIANQKKVKKKIIYIGLIVTQKFWVCRFDGFFFKFLFNKIILFNRQFKFLWTRLYGVFCKELKTKVLLHQERQSFLKLYSYTPVII